MVRLWPIPCATGDIGNTLVAVGLGAPSRPSRTRATGPGGDRRATTGGTATRAAVARGPHAGAGHCSRVGASKARCWLRRLGLGGTVVSALSVWCRRSSWPFCAGCPGAIRSGMLPSLIHHTASGVRLPAPGWRTAGRYRCGSPVAGHTRARPVPAPGGPGSARVGQPPTGQHACRWRPRHSVRASTPRAAPFAATRPPFSGPGGVRALHREQPPGHLGTGRQRVSVRGPTAVPQPGIPPRLEAVDPRVPGLATDAESPAQCGDRLFPSQPRRYEPALLPSRARLRPWHHITPHASAS